MMSLSILEMVAIAVEAADNKPDIAAPFGGFLEALNGMYKEGAYEARDKHKDKQRTLDKVDVDLFVVNLAMQGIFIQAWVEAHSLDEMKVVIAKGVRELKRDIENQIAEQAGKVMEIDPS